MRTLPFRTEYSVSDLQVVGRALLEERAEFEEHVSSLKVRTPKMNREINEKRLLMKIDAEAITNCFKIFRTKKAA